MVKQSIKQTPYSTMGTRLLAKYAARWSSRKLPYDILEIVARALGQTISEYLRDV
jgi:hypothetical protein